MVKPHSVGRHGDRGGNLTPHDAKHTERGQAMVEFALTITVTLLLVFGMIDLSRAVYTASVIQWAAQQGARVGAVELSRNRALSPTVEEAVKARLVWLNPDKANVPPPQVVNNVVEVEVSYQYDFMIPLISRITGDSITLTASASMVAY